MIRLPPSKPGERKKPPVAALRLKGNPELLSRQVSDINRLTPRSNLAEKRAAARKLQSAFRRKRWRVLLKSVGQGAGGCFCQNPAYRPLVDRYGEVMGVRGPSGRWYVGFALGCLSPIHSVRALFIILIEAPWFDHLILLTIMVNCFVLALSGRPEDSVLYVDPDLTESLEMAFAIVFTAELGCKAVAMGVFTDRYHSLLSDRWNQLDLVVVVSAWLPLLFPSLNRAASTSLRALRAFRPLRAAHILPGVRRQVNTLLKALPSLGNVSLLIFFISGSFAILGMQLFKGSLHHRCYADEDLRAAGLDPAAFKPGDTAPLAVEPVDPQAGVCNPLGAPLSPTMMARIAAHSAGWERTEQLIVDVRIQLYGEDVGVNGSSSSYSSSRSSHGVCASGVCLDYGPSPYYGTISFDTIGSAMMTVLMCVTGEGWSQVMYATMHGTHPASCTYFVTLALLGTFYIVNLFLAVLWETYSSLPKELTPEEQVEKKRWEAEHYDDDEEYEQEPLVAAKLRAMPPTLVGSKSTSIDSDSFPKQAEIGPMNAFRGWLRGVVTSNQFRYTIMALILANTALMMLERHPQPAYQRDLIEYGNLFFFGVYAIEMLAKLVALGIGRYWAEPFNRFDGAIVLVSGAEIGVDYFGIDVVGLNAQVLRTLRLLRIFKLARSWNNLYVVISSLLLTLAQLRDLFIVLLLWLFVCALLGMQLFGGGVLRGTADRDMYDSIEHAMISVFIAVTGEQWNEQWMHTYRALGLWTGGYFVLLVATGDYIILNLVIAIVIREVGKADAYVRRLNNEAQSLVYEGNATVRNRKFSLLFASIVPPRDGFEEELDGLGAKGGAQAFWRTACWSLGDFIDRRRHHSLLLFAPDSSFRACAKWILRARLPGLGLGLESAVLITIFVSSCAVAFDAGCDSSTGLAKLGTESFKLMQMPHYLVAYLSFALAISLIEIVVKAVAYGLVGSDEAYLTSGWHQLDAVIALLCIAEVVDTGSGGYGGLPAPLILRSIHVLRPIRLIARHSGMQKVVRVLYEVLPRVLNILLVYVLFLTVFAVLGMQLFAGRFGSCASDRSLSTKADCEGAGERWKVHPEAGSFDNIGDAMLVLFEISSLEGWPRIMYLGIDSVGVDVAMQKDNNLFAGLYFVLWVFLGGFVVLNVFVGVLIDTFAQMENHDRFGGVFTSHQQQHWVETLEASTSVQPLRRHRQPSGVCVSCRSWVYRHVTHPRTETLIMGVILLNSLIMALDGDGTSELVHATLELANDACTLIFVVEVVLKLIAFGLVDFVTEGWNIFDLVVVGFAVAEKTVEALAGSVVNGSLFRLMRLARAARVLRTLRMIKASRSIQSLLMTLLYSVPPLLNILSIFCILIFVYAVLGMELFSGVIWGEYLNAEANFCSFGVAVLTMFRCATGEDWNGIMHDAMAGPRHSHCDPAAGNCGTWLAIPFFVSYTILSSFVILKMLIALIIENYKLSKREDERLVRTAHRDAFVEAWAVLDPLGEGQLPVAKLPTLIRSLDPPLGLDKYSIFAKQQGRALRERDISTFILRLDLVAYQARGTSEKVVLFHDVLLALTSQALDAQAQADASAAPTRRCGGRTDRSDADATSHRSPSRSPDSYRAPGALSAHGKAGASQADLLAAVARSRAKAGIAVREMHQRKHSIADEYDLGNLRAMFAARARVSTAATAPAASSPVALSDSHFGVAMLAHELLYSLSDEYAATVLQQRWRARQRRTKEQRQEALRA